MTEEKSPPAIKILTCSEAWFEVSPKNKEHLEVLKNQNPNNLYRDSRLVKLHSVNTAIEITASDGPGFFLYSVTLANFTVGEVLHCLNKGIEEVEDTETYILYHMRKMFNQSGSFTTSIKGKVVKQNIWTEPGTVRFFARDLIAVCDGINWYKLEL
jgi:hypothetical protein